MLRYRVLTRSTDEDKSLEVRYTVRAESRGLFTGYTSTDVDVSLPSRPTVKLPRVMSLGTHGRTCRYQREFDFA
jgi:hypothetical protein